MVLLKQYNMKLKKKNKTTDFFCSVSTLAVSMMQPVIPSVVKGVSGWGVRRAG